MTRKDKTKPSKSLLIGTLAVILSLTHAASFRSVEDSIIQLRFRKFTMAFKLKNPFSPSVTETWQFQN